MLLHASRWRSRDDAEERFLAEKDSRRLSVSRDMQIHVINLERSADRRANIRAQLDPLELDYVFFDAIPGHRGHRYFARYDHRQSMLNVGRVTTPDEIGCFASHRVLWEHCVSENEPILIMEDDAAIQANFTAALREIGRLTPRYGLIRLQSDEPGQRARTIPVERSGPFTIHYCEKFPYGAMCYAITPRVASAFIDKSHVVTGPVDLFIRKFWAHGQPLFAVTPYPIEGSPIRERSTISGRAETKPGPGLRMLRAVNKLRDRIGRTRFNSAYRRRYAEPRLRRPGGAGSPASEQLPPGRSAPIE